MGKFQKSLEFALYQFRKHGYNQKKREGSSLHLRRRIFLYNTIVVTVALVASALVACLGMSIFSEQIPIDYFVRKLVGSPEAYAGAFSVCWEMFPVLIGSGLVLYYRKMSIMGVIFSSAAAGMLLHLLFS